MVPRVPERPGQALCQPQWQEPHRRAKGRWSDNLSMEQAGEGKVLWVRKIPQASIAGRKLLHPLTQPHYQVLGKGPRTSWFSEGSIFLSDQCSSSPGLFEIWLRFRVRGWASLDAIWYPSRIKGDLLLLERMFLPLFLWVPDPTIIADFEIINPS